jgi:hypothetical protein
VTAFLPAIAVAADADLLPPNKHRLGGEHASASENAQLDASSPATAGARAPLRHSDQPVIVTTLL